MAGLFKPGQLVTIDPMLMSSDNVLRLYNVPGGVMRVLAEDVRAIGFMKLGDVALVIARERTRAGEVYVVGPRGGGWAPGAFLKILVEVKGNNASPTG